MNGAHVHLIINHVPVLGTFALVAWILFARSKRSPGLEAGADWFAVALAIAGVVVYLTGEPAEDVVESLPGISKQLIEAHEDRALIALLFLGASGAIALIKRLLPRFRRTEPFPLVYPEIAAALVAAALMAWVANLGGQISHPEIRDAAHAGKK